MDQLQTQIQAELPFCRLCFSQDCELYELFPGAGNDNESLLLKILEVLAIPISFDDDLNSFICGKCVTTVEDFYEYKEKVKENDVLLRERRKSVEQATAIYNVVSMQPDAANSSSSASNGATCVDGGGGGGQDLGGAGVIDESHVGGAMLDHRISIEGNTPLNGNIIEFKKQLFTASPTQLGIWLCVASGSDIQCPAAIEVDDNIQVVAEIVSGTASTSGTSSSTTKSSSSKKKKSRDPSSKRKVSNDMLVGDGWLTDVTTFKRNHYQLVTKDGYQTFLIYNGYRFRTQQKIRNGIAAWKCAWNGRKGCQAILHISEDYQKVKEVGSPHNHEPSLRDRIISNKPSNGNASDQSIIMQSDDGEEIEMHKIVHTTANPGASTTVVAATSGETITLGGGATVVAITAGTTTTTSTSTTPSTTLDLAGAEMDFVQQSSSSGSSEHLITTTTTAGGSGGGGSASGSAGDHAHHQHHHHQHQHQQQQQHHHPHHHSHHTHEVVSVVDEVGVVVKEDTSMSMDIEEIIRPHVVLHPANE
ncbi:elongation factor 1-alpha [Anopheles sinensis]|uniref:Elongation factor 1-alpha n=1 Tax=Anopheles sinensis TaxID=74873 RepID=A0A084VLB4_ANOSI|nr:elongation factor 1-alpha [Anopheles sinensis]